MEEYHRSKHPKRVSGRALGITHFCRHLFFSHGPRGELSISILLKYMVLTCVLLDTQPPCFFWKRLSMHTDMHLVQSLRKLQTIYKIKPLEIMFCYLGGYICGKWEEELGCTKSSNSGKWSFCEPRLWFQKATFDRKFETRNWAFYR